MTSTSEGDAKVLHLPSKGVVQLCIDKCSSGSKVFACSTDGDVWEWDEKSLEGDKEPLERNIAQRTHATIACWNSMLLVGRSAIDLLTNSEKQVLSRYDSNELSTADRELLSFSLDLSSCDVNNDWIVAGATDFVIKWIRREDGSGYGRIEADAIPLCLALSPTDSLLAVSFCDGSVCIYRLPDAKQIASFPHFFPRSSDVSATVCRGGLVWSADGTSLWAAGDKSVRHIRRQGADEYRLNAKPLIHPQAKQELFSVLSLSSDGAYLAAGSVGGAVVVWRLLDSTPTVLLHHTRQNKPATVSSICFVPNSNSKLLIADTAKGLCVLSNVTGQAVSQQSSVPLERKDSFDLDGDAARDASSPANAIERDGDDENTNMSADLGAIKKRFGFGDDNDDTDLASERGGGNDLDRLFDRSPPRREFASGDPKPPLAYSAPVHVAPAYTPPVPPSRFSSAASPSGKSHRFLKWNAFGVIRASFDDDDGNANVQISWHDSSVNADIVLDNSTSQFCMGDMSDRAAAVASEETEERQSELLVLCIACWDAESRRWTAQLPKGDGALDLCVTRKMIAVVTTGRNVRVWTLAGTQRHIVSYPAGLVSVCAIDERLAVAHLRGGVVADDEWPLDITEFSLPLSISAHPSFSTRPLPLSAKSRLIWIGYSNGRGLLCSMDNSQVLRLLSISGCWSPIFDAGQLLQNFTTGKDTAWPIAVIDQPLTQFRYVLCRSSQCPSASSSVRPVMSLAEWQPPLCHMDTQKSKLECELITSQLIGSLSSAAGTTTLVKLFALACRAEREARASELAELGNGDLRTVQLMCDYAAKARRGVLAEKVAAVLRLLEQDEEEEEGEGNDNVAPASSADHFMASQSQLALGEEASTLAPPRRVSFPARRPSVATYTPPIRKVAQDDESQQSYTSHIEDSEAASLAPLSNDDDELGVSQSTTSMLAAAAAPTPAMRNPFKRAPPPPSPVGVTSSESVFERMQQSGDKRRRLLQNQPDSAATPSPTTRRLPLGPAANNTAAAAPSPTSGSSKKKPLHGKSAAPSAYDLWLADSEQRLRDEFAGAPADFALFCIGRFKILPAQDKQEWKQRATAAKQDSQ